MHACVCSDCIRLSDMQKLRVNLSKGFLVGFISGWRFGGCLITYVIISTTYMYMYMYEQGSK